MLLLSSGGGEGVSIKPLEYSDFLRQILDDFVDAKVTVRKIHKAARHPRDAS